MTQKNPDRRPHLDICKKTYNDFKRLKDQLVEIQKSCPECLRRRIAADAQREQEASQASTRG
jgi:hypothetical protein